MAVTKCFICLTTLAGEGEDTSKNCTSHMKKESIESEKTNYGELMNIFTKYWQIEFKENDRQSLELEPNKIQLCDCCRIVALELIGVVTQLESLQENLNKLLSKVVLSIIESKSVHPHSSDESDASNIKIEQDDDLDKCGNILNIQSIRKTLIQSFDVKVKLTACKSKRYRWRKAARGKAKSSSIIVSSHISGENVEGGPSQLASGDDNIQVIPESCDNQNLPDFDNENNCNGQWKTFSAKYKVSSSETKQDAQRPKRSHKILSLKSKTSHSNSPVNNSICEGRKQNHSRQIGTGKYIYQGYKFSDLGNGYQCDTCPVSCTGSSRNRENMMLHLKRCHIDQGKFPCKVCGKAFGTGKELRRHGIVHETLRRHMCELCGKTFKMPYQLQLHMKRHSSMRNHQCEICQKKFTTVYSLQNHVKRVHEGIRDFQCNKCLFKFTSSSSLKRHVRAHDRDCQAKQNCNMNLLDRPFICENCGARLASKYSLKYHMITVHAAMKNFACSVCDKKFKTRKALRRHAVCHSDEYDYMCTICGLRLKRARSLKLHMMTHEGIKRFECEICNVKFAYDQGRKIHIATVHEGQKNYECKTCFKKFGTPQSLARHHLVHTGERKYICETCGNKYQQSNVLKRHIQEVHLKIKPRPRKPCKKTQLRDSGLQPDLAYSSSTALESMDLCVGESDLSSDKEEQESGAVPPNCTSMTSETVFGDIDIPKLQSLAPVHFDSHYISDTIDYTNPTLVHLVHPSERI